MEFPDIVLAWLLENPVAHAAICLDGVALVGGGFWAWWDRRSLKRRMKDSQEQMGLLQTKSDSLQEQLKQTESNLLDAINHMMVGQPVATQKDIYLNFGETIRVSDDVSTPELLLKQLAPAMSLELAASEDRAHETLPSSPVRFAERETINQELRQLGINAPHPMNDAAYIPFLATLLPVARRGDVEAARHVHQPNRQTDDD